MSVSSVEKKWSTLQPEVEKCFFGFPPLRPYLISLAYGDELARLQKDNRWWAEDIFTDLYLRERPVRRVLSLCCGFGIVEQHLLQRLPGAPSCMALDVAEGALEVARERAAGLGLDIEYKRADLNRCSFGDAEYDLVIANGALHHLSNLEGVLEAVNRCLTPTGILYASETVGPSLQDFPSRQLELINAVAYLVPPELRLRRGFMGHSSRSGMIAHMMRDLLHGRLTIDERSFSGRELQMARVLRRLFPSARERHYEFAPLRISHKQKLLREDPSEGVRSSEIIAVMRRTFGEVEEHPYGGPILTYALDRGFYDGYDDENPNHRALLDLFCNIERHYMSSGELRTEHAILIASRRPAM